MNVINKKMVYFCNFNFYIKIIMITDDDDDDDREICMTKCNQ